LVDDFEKSKAKNGEIYVGLSGDLNVGGKLFVGGRQNAKREKYVGAGVQARIARVGKRRQKVER
jgi:hypothetical protein